MTNQVTRYPVTELTIEAVQGYILHCLDQDWLPGPDECAEWFVDGCAARGDYGREGEYDDFAIEHDYTQVQHWARDLLGVKE